MRVKIVKLVIEVIRIFYNKHFYDRKRAIKN